MNPIAYRTALVFVVALSALSRNVVFAQVIVIGGHAQLSHDGGFGGITNDRSVQVGIPPLPQILPNAQDNILPYSGTILGPGGNISTAQGGLGYAVDQSLFRFSLPAGTGVSQYAPAGGNTPAVLEITTQSFFEAVDFDPAGFQLSRWFYDVPLAGVVPVGGYVDFLLSMTLWDGSFPQPIVTHYHNSTPGPFQVLLFDSGPLPSNYPYPVTTASIDNAYFGFTVLDPEGAGEIFLSRDLSVSSVPEPASIRLVGSALVMVVGAYLVRLRRQLSGHNIPAHG